MQAEIGRQLILEMKARYSFKRTDNSSFILGVGSWDDGQLSWAVLSTIPKLDLGTEERVLDFVKSIRMDEKLAIANEYEGCWGKKEASGINNEL
jgi:hypothetical protein